MNETTERSSFRSFIELTSYVNWELVSEKFEEANKTRQSFYREDFKSLLSQMADSDDFYVPSYTTMCQHIQKIKFKALTEGSDNSISENEWLQLYNEYQASHQPLTVFFELNRKRFPNIGYSWVNKKMHLLMMQLDPDKVSKRAPRSNLKAQKVKVVNLSAKAFAPTTNDKQGAAKKDNLKASTLSNLKESKDTTIIINLCGGKSISFNTSTPEESVAKLLRSLEQH